ncbi:hybrid sensor histidine kinase/response regulator transcription factor [Portibacter lacus]|uniref:histidine kinase n=1 Tax=Portibacter lacus TaxID=1099794 RepID=A0AA37WDR3_9BACT|nr:ATP-binding protein [Portibacter lacus]GLR17278.1 hybrid sensor histidine kinase/response regulator [Portibacter lacus]
MNNFQFVYLNMCKFLKLAMFLLIAVCAKPASAQFNQDIFSKVSEDLGLNNSTITTITQDHRGYLWFGSWLGLYRYDGNICKAYTIRSNQQGHLASNKITCLLVSKKGELYIGTQRGGILRYLYETDEFEKIEEEGLNNNVFRTNIWALYEDHSGKIWAGTENGITIYDPEKGTSSNHDVFLKSDINSRRVQFIGSCGTDYIWAGTDNGVFTFLLEKNQTITEMGHYTFAFPEKGLQESNFISAMMADHTNPKNIFLLEKNGVISLDFSDGFENTVSTLSLQTDKSFHFPKVVGTSSYFQDAYLLGTDNGLRSFSFDGHISDELYIENKIIKTIYEDSFGSLWVGTEGGLYKFNNIELLFRNEKFKDQKTDDFDQITYLTKSPLTQDIWVAWQSGAISRIVNRNGDYHFSEAENFSILNRKNIVLRERISQIDIDLNGDVWIATQGAGLIQFNEKSKFLTHQIKPQRILDYDNEIPDGYLMSLLTEEEKIWVGTWNHGLFIYNKNTKKVEEVEIIKNQFNNLTAIPIIKIIDLKNGKNEFVLGTRGAGLFIIKYSDESSTIEILEHISTTLSAEELTSDFITDLYLNDNKLWVATEAGLNLYDVINKSFITFNLKAELSEMVIQSIAAISDSTLWISTNKNGILEINKSSDTYSLKHYTRNTLTNYANSSILKVDDTHLLLGGSDGFTVINTQNKLDQLVAPIPMIKDIRINNHPITLNEEINGSQKINTVISEWPDVKLNHKDKMVSFEINAMQTAEFKGITYAYKLEPFHQDWIFANEDEKLVHLTNLPYKSFQFRFKAANSDGLWSDEKILKISVSPPWWRSPFAYVLYFLLFCTVLYGIIKIIAIKAKYDHDIKLERLERSQVEEINQLKLNFYTSISHELRTPLTMIISPLEQLMKSANDNQNKQSYEFIMRNAKKLLSLVNQILDFRKHESLNLELKLKTMDFIDFTNEIIINFTSLAKRNDVTLTFDSGIEKLYMAFDEEEMEKLYNNLISNALKHTPSGGTIHVSVKNKLVDNRVLISISDTGRGIKEKDLKRIFERFYQGENHAESGYGIGLSIVDAIVKIHEGEIRITSEFEQGTTVEIEIPTDLQVAIEHKTSELPEANPDVLPGITLDETLKAAFVSEEIKEVRKKILIVEDNIDIKEYLKINLETEYDVSEASDGIVGFNIAMHEVPDLIISDIAMPLKDGLELCKDLKGNMVTSHIPVILLTARTSLNYKLNGFDYGVNAYVTKPFNMELLKKRIKSLIEYEEILKQKYSIKNNSLASEIKVAQPVEDTFENKFIKQLVNIVNEHISDSDFSVEDIAKAMNMSKIQLYRKMKATLNETPNAFIRIIRLKKAAQLLETSDLNISEITYNVGFNDLKYFREKFKEEFKMNPSAYRKQLKTITQTSR